MIIILKKLEWDSNFWNENIYEINIEEIEENIQINLEEKSYLIQAKVDIDKIKQINILEKLGFYFKDLEVEYEKNIDEYFYEKIEKIENLKLNDIENLIEPLIKNSRFDIFDEKKILEFYETWVKNAIKGIYDDECFFIKENSEIAGLISYKKNNDFYARIGLLSIWDKYQRKNLGTYLLRSIESYLYKNGIKKLSICTQGKNKIANNFYIKNGYKIKNTKVIMYLKK